MEANRIPQVVVGLYRSLADAQAAQEELQAAGVTYSDIRLSAHAATDADRPLIEAANPPDQFWSLAAPAGAQAEEILERHGPFAVGRADAPNAGRSSADRGALAWRGYVFETPAATDAIGETAGATGMTGVISSGVFASGALAEGPPSVRGLPEADQGSAGDQVAPPSESGD